MAAKVGFPEGHGHITESDDLLVVTVSPIAHREDCSAAFHQKIEHILVGGASLLDAMSAAFADTEYRAVAAIVVYDGEIIAATDGSTSSCGGGVTLADDVPGPIPVTYGKLANGKGVWQALPDAAMVRSVTVADASGFELLRFEHGATTKQQ